MEYRITDDASREAVFGNAEQYISDVKESWMYMGTFSGMDEFKHSETREVKKVPVETVPGMGKRYRYWVEFIDHDGIQQSLYLCGQSNEHIKAMMDGYDIVVIDNLEIPEKCYWAEEEVQS